MRILVTGGAGYLGAVLCGHLLEEGHQVRVLDNLTFGKSPLNSCLKRSKFELMIGDKRNTNTIEAAVDGMDIVVDLAAVVGNKACKNNRKACWSTNTDATKMLYEVSLKQDVDGFIFASTCSLYADSNGQEVDEKDLVKPASQYTKSKYLAEKILKDSSGNLRTIALRLSTLCGPSPRMRFDLVLNRMVAMAIKEQKIVVKGGKQWRPLLDVRDAAYCITWLMEDISYSEGFQILNVGTNDANMRIDDLAKLIRKEIDNVQIVTESPKEKLSSYRVDFSKITDWGFQPTWRLEKSVQGVKELFASNKIENYTEPIYSNSEISYDMT